MFKVLVIAYYYPPLGLSGVQRTLKFTKYFSQYNWKPTVITTGKSGYFAHDETLLAEAEEAQVEIVRTESLTPSTFLKSKGNVSMPSSFIMKILGRISKTFFIPDNKILWSRKAAKYARTLLSQQNFDAIFISAPPFSSIVSIIKLKQKYDIPIFVDYRDSWITNQFRFYPTPYHAYRHKKLENTALRKVDRIIAVNRLIKEDLIKSHPFLKFNDVDIIPHGFDPADFQDIVPREKETHKLVIAYSGIFYEGITPKFLLKAFKKLTLENPDIALNIKLQFIGHFKKENHKIVTKLKLENFVEDVGYLSHKEALTRLISSDILWIMLPQGDRMFNVTPGKIFEYFGTKKPIIANLPEGISKNLIKEYGASFITNPNDVDEIKNTLLKCHELYLKGKLPKPNDEFVNRYNRINLTEQLVKNLSILLKDRIMNILIIGSGGREHAIALKLFEENKYINLFISPGNGGTHSIGKNIELELNNVSDIIDFCTSENIELVIIGPEQPLVDGLANDLRNAGIDVFGPNKNAARIEGDKSFAKDLMQKYQVPTAKFKSFFKSDYIKAIEYLQSSDFPIVLKASGLAAGKGVIIANTFNEAQTALNEMMKESKFGSAGDYVVIEEFLEGPELSVFVVTDGSDYVILPPAQDHKRIGEGDTGKNTGGMGAFSPVPFVNKILIEEIEQNVILPILQGLREKDSNFNGCLYCGLIKTADGIKVIEFNCRFGDPEIQAVLQLVEGDFLELLNSTAKGKVNLNSVKYNGGSAVCVVAASGGYPDSYEKGKEILGLDSEFNDNVKIIHAGTKKENDKIFTSGGRVLNIVSYSSKNDIKDCITKAYTALAHITYEGIYFRKDIGTKALM